MKRTFLTSTYSTAAFCPRLPRLPTLERGRHRQNKNSLKHAQGILPLLPYSVTRSAGEAVDGDEAAPGADGDAVVARGDNRVGDLHVLALPDVDAVRVGAVPGGNDGQLLHPDGPAGDDHDVHLRAVHAAEVAQLQVVALHHFKRLV
jgi:hypothetical protein